MLVTKHTHKHTPTHPPPQKKKRLTVQCWNSQGNNHLHFLISMGPHAAGLCKEYSSNLSQVISFFRSQIIIVLGWFVFATTFNCKDFLPGKLFHRYWGFSIFLPQQWNRIVPFKDTVLQVLTDHSTLLIMVWITIKYKWGYQNRHHLSLK